MREDQRKQLANLVEPKSKIVFDRDCIESVSFGTPSADQTAADGAVFFTVPKPLRARIVTTWPAGSFTHSYAIYQAEQTVDRGLEKTAKTIRLLAKTGNQIAAGIARADLQLNTEVLLKPGFFYLFKWTTSTGSGTYLVPALTDTVTGGLYNKWTTTAGLGNYPEKDVAVSAGATGHAPAFQILSEIGSSYGVVL